MPRLRRHPLRRRAAALAFGAAAAVAAASASAGDGTVLEITAPEGAGPTAFTLVCDGVAERATTPFRRSFDVDALACEIRADGPLVVEGRAGGGNVTRMRTSGGVVRLNLS